MKNILLFAMISLAIFSCKKENPPANNATPPPDPLVLLNSAQIHSVDSSCFLIPNVFTPNGDGYNDYFFPGYKNIDSVHMTIRNLTYDTLFSSSLMFWDGLVSTGPIRGFYLYDIFIRTTSGVTNVLTGKIFVSVNPETDCFKNDVPPKTSDMMDPNACGFIYNTSEIFCQ